MNVSTIGADKHGAENQGEIGIRAWFKTGSGTFVRSTLRAVPAKVPDPVLNQAAFDCDLPT
jgi:hypothetical protein